MHFLAYVLVSEEQICRKERDEAHMVARAMCEGIVPEGSEDIGIAVAELLQPYSEHLEVHPYEVVCDCIEDGAFWMASKVTEERFGPEPPRRFILDGMMISTGQKPSEKEPAQDQRRNFLWEQYSERLLSQPPDPACDLCAGSGKKEVTYNPVAKWDWWVVGEGFSKGILVPAIKTSSEIPYNEEMVPLKSLVLQKLEIPYALVTPDGQWHDETQKSYEQAPQNITWEAMVRTLLGQHEDCILVAVNFHR